MALLFKSDIDREGNWERALRAHKPELEVRTWPDLGDPGEIEYALVWGPPEGLLKTLPNLRAIFSFGAGIDHLASDPDLPHHVPVVRMVEPGLTAGMTEFVVMSVLHHHRFMVDYEVQRRAGIWREIQQVPACGRRVGILGLGVLGTDAALKLAGFGFEMAGWSRGPKEVPGVASFHGPDGLVSFLNRSDILVCLLPLTAETNGILNARILAALPRGAAVVNLARGGHQVEEDLLAALDSGHISGVTLDVFRNEPLPEGHPFWTHPRVVMTPHIASMTIPESAAAAVIENIERIEAGQAPLHRVDFDRGY